MEYVSENKSHVASGCMLSDWVIVGPRKDHFLQEKIYKYRDIPRKTWENTGRIVCVICEVFKIDLSIFFIILVSCH